MHSKHLDTLTNVLLSIFSILPYWIFQNFNSLDITVIGIFLIFFLFLITVNLLILKIKNKKIKNICLSIYISTIFFYCIDSKIGLWTLFLDLTKIGILNYFLSFIFVLFILIILYKITIKNYFLLKKIFLLTAFFLFSINFISNYYFIDKHQNLENLKILKKDFDSLNSNNNKIVILHLDQIVGYDGVDESTEYGILAKKSYYELFKKYNFHVFTSAYSIYRNTFESIPHLLNFDYQTSVYDPKTYIKEDLFDRKSKWVLKKNKFFENNKNKKIVSYKNQAINFCSIFSDKCISSNTINNLKEYSNDFKFTSTDFFFKKMHDQKSIIFQYFWRFLYMTKFFNHYESLTFNKVKFEGDLKMLNQFIASTKYDIYFFHFLFPHRPFFFDVNLDEKKCSTNIDYLDNSYFKNNNEILNQHYKEIICTNFYLDKFISKLDLKKTKLLILSDTGVQSDDEKNFIRDSYSVLFAIRSPKNKFQMDDNLISSQELFSYFFNQQHKKSLIEKNTNKFIFLDKEKTYSKIKKF